MKKVYNTHSYLWDGSEDGWILVEDILSQGGVMMYSIYNKLSRMALILEDDCENAYCVEMMIASGVEIVKSIRGLQ